MFHSTRVVLKASSSTMEMRRHESDGLFDKLDTDMDGTLSLGELKQGISKIRSVTGETNFLPARRRLSLPVATFPWSFTALAIFEPPLPSRCLIRGPLSAGLEMKAKQILLEADASHDLKLDKDEFFTFVDKVMHRPHVSMLLLVLLLPLLVAHHELILVHHRAIPDD